MIVSCPDCRESVRLDGNLPDQAILRCPWCRSTYSVESILSKIPAFEVVSGMGNEPVTAGLRATEEFIPDGKIPVFVAGATEQEWNGTAEESLNHGAFVEDPFSSAEEEAVEVTLEGEAVKERTEEGLLEPDELTEWETISNDEEVQLETTADEAASEEREWDNPQHAWSPEQEWSPSESMEGDDSQPLEPKLRRRRASPSPLKTVAQIIAGGVGGLLGAGAILWYLGKLPADVANLLGVGNAKNVASVGSDPLPKLQPTTLNMPDFSSIPIPSLDGEKEQQNSRQMQELGSGDLSKGESTPSATDVPESATDKPGTEPAADDVSTPANAAITESGVKEEKKPDPNVGPDMAANLPSLDELLKPAESSKPASEPLSLDARSKHSAAMQALIQLSENPNDNARRGALFRSLATLANALPEGNEFPKEVNLLIESLAEQKEFNQVVATKVLKLWWDDKAKRGGNEGVYAIGTVSEGGKAINTEGGVKLPLKVNEGAYPNGQQVLLLGKIVGEGTEQQVVPVGIYPLSNGSEADPLN